MCQGPVLHCMEHLLCKCALWISFLSCQCVP
uniref:Uncharacterized protein n=1 Tax=Rhizophora mucronata TaxID=61149 RepID=A0A2P2QL17_RHIMU